MFEVFLEFNVKYFQLDVEFFLDIKKMIDVFMQGLVMNSQEEEDGLWLGVDILGMLFFLVVCSCLVEKGLFVLQYLCKYYGIIGVFKDLKKYFLMYFVEYFFYLVEVMMFFCENVEVYF